MGEGAGERGRSFTLCAQAKLKTFSNSAVMFSDSNLRETVVGEASPLGPRSAIQEQMEALVLIHRQRGGISAISCEKDCRFE